MSDPRQIFVCIIYSRGSVLLRRLCTSGFIDAAIFAQYTGARYVAASDVILSYYQLTPLLRRVVV